MGIRIYTVIDKNCDKVSQEKHHLMHEHYTTQNFNKSIRMCQDLMGEFGGQLDKYYDMWIERCIYMKTQTLPKDWNGVFIATTK